MKVIERQVIAKMVAQTYDQNGRTETVRHFRALGQKPNTIRAIIRRYIKTGSYECMPKSCRKRSVATPKVTNDVKRKLLNSNKSEQRVADEVKISRSTVHNIKRRLNIRTNKCTETPKYTQTAHKG